MNKTTKWITQTALMTALLLVLQVVTKAGGQLLTGSCVNLVLAVSVLIGGIWCGVTVAALSPFFAFLLGIGPQLLPIVPAIAVGNVVLVVVLHLICGKKQGWLRSLLAWVSASALKFLALYLLVVQLLCRVLELKPQQVTTFTAMFSWPQLVTALIGSGVALLVFRLVRKGIQ